MSHVVVTIETPDRERTDLALPMNVPNQVLAQEVGKALGLPEPRDFVYLFSVKTEDGIVRLSENTTLADAGILDGFILLLQRRERQAPVQAAPPTSAKAYLQAESGQMFALQAAITTIGRKDLKRGLLVDIDLTPLDLGKIISRRHAAIEQKEDQYLLQDQDSANGTWLNGQRLAPQAASPLKDGDQIVFGHNGIEMVFRMA